MTQIVIETVRDDLSFPFFEKKLKKTFYLVCDNFFLRDTRDAYVHDTWVAVIGLIGPGMRPFEHRYARI